MDLGIDGNAALVTAGTAGLGLASAEALAEAGADVAVCGRDEDRLDRAEARLGTAGDGDVLAVRADITDPDDVEAFVDTTVGTFGRLDHVVTSAGGPPPGSFLDTDDEDWYDAYDMLVMSVVRTVRAAHPTLSADGGGTVVTITSRTVREILDDLVLSNAVRRAVLGLTKSLADEFAPAIRVNTVLPGAHETSRIEELIEASVDRGEYEHYEDGLAEWSEGVPLARVGDPRELGDTVAWLSSDRASYINGVAVPVDGGSMRGI
ncbi:SDR family oxidoreductase [Natronomonas sp. LN261]|jgi:3-oxoacyl-[acyl-carrier protein] reductase|uniref:SDR family oxidoreductase n=1 Tax=Natronomonas sp. LN261 TaxID=2750669 RepID=UPI0015EEAEB5|nr:SDR family oxidoreductase [Natronomonas sp. LN261]